AARPFFRVTFVLCPFPDDRRASHCRRKRSLARERFHATITIEENLLLREKRPKLDDGPVDHPVEGKIGWAGNGDENKDCQQQHPRPQASLLRPRHLIRSHAFVSLGDSGQFSAASACSTTGVVPELSCSTRGRARRHSIAGSRASESGELYSPPPPFFAPGAVTVFFGTIAIFTFSRISGGCPMISFTSCASSSPVM